VTIEFTCHCGQRLATKNEFIGKVVKCPKCGGRVEVPDNRNPVLELLDEEGVYGSPECPNCIPPHEVVCVKCGYNKKLGRKMNTERR
jgi:hypothetical protein